MLTGYIDLSKRRVSPEEVVKCEERFAKAKAVSRVFLMKCLMDRQMSILQRYSR